MSSYPDKLKPEAGKEINFVRRNIENDLKEVKEKLTEIEYDKKLREEKFDLTPAW